MAIIITDRVVITSHITKPRIAFYGFYKGVIASDVNNDRYPDLYISTLTAENLLFINQERNGKRIFIPTVPQTILVSL
jgi:hypothetical protein